MNQNRGEPAEKPAIEPHLTTLGVDGSKELDSEAQHRTVSVPAADRGFHAWAYLTAAWILDLLIWGLAFTYGVFLDFYRIHEFPGTSSGLLALPGSLSNGILYLSTIVIMPLVIRFPEHHRKMMVVGGIVCISGLIGAAFATVAWQLVLFQGVLFAFGGSILYYPIMSYIFEWFPGRKGFANGVLFSGASIGGVFMPFMIQPLLERYGRKATLIGLAISFVVVIVPCFPFFRPRLPIHRQERGSLDRKFLSSKVFWILLASAFLQGLGTFMPPLFLPSFATELKMSSTVGNLTIALYNGISGPGLIFIGWLSDRFDLRISLLLSCVGSALSVFLLWGFSGSLAPLLVFSCVYGFLAPSYAAMYPKFAAASVGDDSKPSSTLVYVFMGARGIGNALTAPISAGLMHPWSLTNKVHFGYGTAGYGPLILFTGATLLSSAVGLLYHYFDESGKK